MTRMAFAGAFLVALALPLTASAQPAADATQPPVNQGPMTVERIHSGFAATPEVKITDFDGKASGLIGGSAGYVAEEAFFIGGGGYWMATDRSHFRELAYGGFVMQWFVLNNDRFGVSGKVLLGGGQATTPQTVTQVVGLPSPRELDRLTQAQYNDLVRAHTVTSTIGLRQDFFVAEPEINARIAIAKAVRLTFGAGYRFAGDNWWHYHGGGFHNDRISGAVGSFGVQIGG
jgi:hypothetical protein